MALVPLQKCGRRHCSPSRKMRDGGDHVGIDIFVKCTLCGREGPYVECERGTDEIRNIVHQAWNAEIGTIGEEAAK